MIITVHRQVDYPLQDKQRNIMKTEKQIKRKIASLQKEYEVAHKLYGEFLEDAMVNDYHYTTYEHDMDMAMKQINLLKWVLKGI